MGTFSVINAGIEGNHLIGLGGLPTVILGPGAGAGSAIITGTDTACTVTLTAGAGTVTNAIVFTVLFNTPYTVTPHTVFCAGNNNSAATNNRMFVQNTGVNSFEFRITNPALNAGTVYIYKFHTIG